MPPYPKAEIQNLPIRKSESSGREGNYGRPKVIHISIPAAVTVQQHIAGHWTI
jgi:hypothetical protein